ncbi:MAG: tetratricopeptide repeat protein [Synergistaceae bacterium]|nr:tetratricopeptide repeat protein [Synergistaceae bacterium]
MSVFIGKKKRILRCLFALVLGCVFFAFGTEARANGNVSADEIVSQPQNTQKQGKKSVRKAPVKKQVKKRPAKATKKPVRPQPVPAPMALSFLERGISLMEAKRYSQARPWLQRAVQEERRNPYAWYWYGMAHEKIGQMEQAQFFYARALELDPAFPPFVRVVTYPNGEGDRKALWDPRRPAQVYPVETVSNGVVVVPPGAPEATARPTRPPVDPLLPRVPVYVPPEPTTPVIFGDAEQPPVYVPPSFPAFSPVADDVEEQPESILKRYNALIE